MLYKRIVSFVCIIILSLSFTDQSNPTERGNSLRAKRFVSQGEKWIGGTVPYEVDSTITPEFKQTINEVIEDFQVKTCIQFVPRLPSHSTYIRIQLDESKCSMGSQPCRQNGLQTIFIGSKCATRGKVAHAFGRSLCLINEDTRPDRDQYLNISTNNCDQENFPKALDDNQVTANELYYDYLSIMHTLECDGSCVKPRDFNVQKCGGAQELSFLDAEKINRLYNCKGCHWHRFVDIRQKPSNIVIGGVDLDFGYFGICRAIIDGHIFPGKVRSWENGGTTCYLPWNTEIGRTESFEVLTVPQINSLGWIPQKMFNARNAVLGGRKKDGSPVYIARCVLPDGKDQTFFVPGRLDMGKMWYPSGGKEWSCDNYEVLSCIRNSSKGIEQVQVEPDLDGFAVPLETYFRSHAECNAWSYKRATPDLNDVVIAGADLDDSKLGICIAKVNKNIIAGKVRAHSDGIWCYVIKGGEELKLKSKFKILTMQDSRQFRWVSYQNITPNSAVPGGQSEDKIPIYVSRCRDTQDGKKLVIPAKLENGKSWYGFNGGEKMCEDYDVLVCAGVDPTGNEVDVGVLYGYVTRNNTIKTKARPDLEATSGTTVPSNPTDKSDGFKIGFIVLAVLLTLFIICTTAIVMIVKYKAAMDRIHKLTEEEVQEFHVGRLRNGILPNPEDPNVDFADLEFPKSFVIPTQQLSVCMGGKPLGAGQFGEIFRGAYNGQDVAIKKVKETVDIENFRLFLKEIKIMSYIGKHENVIEFYGAAVENLARKRCLVAVELSPYGDLQGFLKNNSGWDEAGNRRLATTTLVGFCAQIAAGMEYLATRKVMHGDLAARKVLVFENLKVKLSDFGLSARLYCSMNYKRKRQVPLPWRWMAPESLRYMEFSIESDVWSFGITTWEIFSYGQVPYPGINYTDDFASQIEGGVRLSKPANAPAAIYNVMKVCWNVEKSRRPSFQELKELLQGYQKEIPTEDNEYYEFLPQPSTSTSQDQFLA